MANPKENVAGKNHEFYTSGSRIINIIIWFKHKE